MGLRTDVGRHEVASVGPRSSLFFGGSFCFFFGCWIFLVIVGIVLLDFCWFLLGFLFFFGFCGLFWEEKTTIAYGFGSKIGT